MGTPLPPSKPGDNCFVCWGDGKPFGNIPTPDVITVQLFSLLPGVFWNPDDELLLLTQHLLPQGPGACRFQVTDEKFTWLLTYFFDRTLFSILRLSDTKPVFRHEAPPICQTSIPNELTEPAGVVSYDGIAHITFI